MKISKVIKVMLLFLSVYDLCGQNKYWVDNADFTAKKLIDSIGIEPYFCSEWAQSCSYRIPEQIFSTNPTLHTLLPVRSLSPTFDHSEEPILGFALEQIESELFIDQNLNGDGVKIGIIDGGFLRANKDASLAHFFNNNLVEYYRDYVTPDLDDYGGSVGLDDIHGTEVWQLIGGYHPEKNIQYGLATGAKYYLARTDHGGYERRIEEDYILQAMEEMAEQGVEIFNISLGYTNGYNDEKENYGIKDIDGKTSVLTRAIQKASVDEGILFVVAAGNDGNTKWGTLSIPADAENILTVGSSKYKVWDKMNFSSYGPEALDYVKPNVCVYSTLGTSFSTPIVTGLAACIMQYDSSLTNLQIINIIEKASNFYPHGNNYVGYGVPTCSNILKILSGKEDQVRRPKEITSTKGKVKLKGAFEGKRVVVYHKKDERNVMHRVNKRPDKNKMVINRPDGTARTSILVETEVIEVFWQD
ncbi:MAG: S8 family serine peptidase [Cyclobacteriaceae bacterium]